MPILLGLHVARNGLQFLPALQNLAILPFNFLETSNEFLPLLLYHLIGHERIGDLNQIARAKRVVLEIRAHGDDLLDYHRGARERLDHGVLTTFNAARDLDFALAGEQRNRAHLAQVHAHRVVDLLTTPAGSSRSISSSLSSSFFSKS